MTSGTHDNGADPSTGERPSSQIRLLPWGIRTAKTSILVTDSGEGVLPRIADEVESALLTSAVEVATCARILLASPRVSAAELRFTLLRMAEALNDVLRIAESRSERSGGPGYRQR